MFTKNLSASAVLVSLLIVGILLVPPILAHTECITITKTVSHTQCDEVYDEYGYSTGETDCYTVSYEEEEETCGNCGEPHYDEAREEYSGTDDEYFNEFGRPADSEDGWDSPCGDDD